MSANPHHISGDYFYQEHRKEAVDATQLTDRTKWILRQTAVNRPHSPKPDYIVVMRDGVSEGQYKMVVDVELKAIEEGCRLVHGASYRPKILVVVATKRHNKRFYLQKGRVVEN